MQIINHDNILNNLLKNIVLINAINIENIFILSTSRIFKKYAHFMAWTNSPLGL